MDVETVDYKEGRLATIVRNGSSISGKEFISPKEDYLQVGFMALKKDETIQPHEHKINERLIERTHEAIYVISGRMKVDFYYEKKKIDERILGSGDLIILASGGHGFQFLEETKIFEIKQGPYSGIDKDKEKFYPLD